MVGSCRMVRSDWGGAAAVGEEDCLAWMRPGMDTRMTRFSAGCCGPTSEVSTRPFVTASIPRTAKQRMRKLLKHKDCRLSASLYNLRLGHNLLSDARACKFTNVRRMQERDPGYPELRAWRSAP